MQKIFFPRMIPENSLCARSCMLLIICIFVFLIAASSCRTGLNNSAGPPNIVYILADDLGYGDLSCLNEHAAWTTPSIDEIAAGGMTFTDAHSGSALCTPTRYGIITGRYSWRSTLKSGVTWSWDKPIIEPDRMTVASLLKDYGYTTACIGKWHLGLGWQMQDEHPDSIDFSKPVAGGPIELGFDYFYGITASLDIPPYVYIENNRPTSIPTKFTVSRDKYGWWRWGHTGDDFIHDRVLPHLTEKAVQFIEGHFAENKENPFFLYIALPAPHTPILPTDEFQGITGTNPYGDFVVQVDWTVGRVMQVLEKHGVTGKTLVIVTSDNGCSPEADYEELARFGHNPSYVFRGHKADIFEGGHRMPFLVRWPDKISPGTTSSQTICLTDLMATCAAILDYALPPEAGVDSYNLLPAFSGEVNDPIREATVHHSANGSFAIRKGKWKLILCPGSGGWSYPRPGVDDMTGMPDVQLYDMENDRAETTNLHDQFPEVVEELKTLLMKYIEEGRSTPGPPQPYIDQAHWPGLEWMKRKSIDPSGSQ